MKHDVGDAAPSWLREWRESERRYQARFLVYGLGIGLGLAAIAIVAILIGLPGLLTTYVGVLVAIVVGQSSGVAGMFGAYFILERQEREPGAVTARQTKERK